MYVAWHKQTPMQAKMNTLICLRHIYGFPSTTLFDHKSTHRPIHSKGSTTPEHINSSTSKPCKNSTTPLPNFDPAHQLINQQAQELINRTTPDLIKPTTPPLLLTRQLANSATNEPTNPPFLSTRQLVNSSTCQLVNYQTHHLTTLVDPSTR